MKICQFLMVILTSMLVWPQFTHVLAAETAANMSTDEKNEDVIRAEEMVPTDPKYIKFFSFPDNKNPQKSHQIQLGTRDTLADSGLIPGEKVTIISHGFYGSYDSNRSSCQPIKNAYLENNFKNIICVDWSKLATPTAAPPLGLLQYTQVVNNVGTVGKTVASFIEFLMENKVISGPEMVHLIGHSLGSHVSGAAGKAIRQRLRRQVRRVTALDPAGPYYYPFQPKLSRYDARFVDCLHTDIEFYGESQSLGDADFFVNGGVGQRQPGCENQNVVDVVDPSKGRCSHRNAWIYYARTIAGEKMIGCRCHKNPTLESLAECFTPADGICRRPAQYGEFGSELVSGDFNIVLTS